MNEPCKAWTVLVLICPFPPPWPTYVKSEVTDSRSEMRACWVIDAGSIVVLWLPRRARVLRLIDFCITQVKAQGPSRTCNESKEEEVTVSRSEMRACWVVDAGSSDLIAGSIQFEYDPDELATKITTQLVHKSNSKTYV